jgi:GNAT superfamily N-acetyltransferase
MIGMAIDINALNFPDAAPSLALELVTNVDMLKAWYSIILNCFPTTYSQTYFDALAAISLRPDADWLHYIGKISGEVVSASSLFLGGGVAGLYNLGTHPQAREQGFGALTTIKTFYEGRERGYRIGTLQTTYPNALRMYHRMGFEVYCKIGIYRYIPKDK